MQLDNIKYKTLKVSLGIEYTNDNSNYLAKITRHAIKIKGQQSQ